MYCMLLLLLLLLLLQWPLSLYAADPQGVQRNQELGQGQQPAAVAVPGHG